MADDYRSYRRFYMSPGYDDEVPSEIPKMRQKVAVQVKDHVLNELDSITVINFLTEFKWACDSLLIHEGAAA